MEKKLKTIDLNGKKYVQVPERVRAIHENEDDFDITTSYSVTESGNIVFSATITIRKVKKIQVFTGHSFGKVGGVKAFEKLETIAVGRALAFAGYHADGEIASAEEMQDFAEGVDKEALADAIRQISESKNVTAMRKTFKDLPKELQQNKEVIEAGKKRKKELTTVNMEE